MTVVIIIPSESDHHHDQASPPWSSLPPGGTLRPCSPQRVITMIRVVVMIVIINEGCRCRWWYRWLQGGRVGHLCKYVMINLWHTRMMTWQNEKKIMFDPINVCTFSSAASWLQSLINLQLFFFVIVVLLLTWWWRGWWRWRLLEIVAASKCWYHDWNRNGQASTPLWPGERRSTFLQAIGLLLCFSF